MSRGLAGVIDAVRGAGVDVVLIGATALAGHGLARSTGDVDLLCVDRRVLDTGFWGALVAGGAEVEVRIGDVEDPLDGVVRLRWGRGRPVDLVVLSRDWTRAIVLRALSGAQVRLGGVFLSIAEVSDLALLKLYADGPQDRADVLALLRLHPEAIEGITQRLGTAPEGVSEAWARLIPQG